MANMSDRIELSEDAKDFKLGTYRHFKGGMYRALYIAHDSETCAEMVVYQGIDSDDVWVRPLAMFLETLDKPEYRGPRFVFIPDKSTR